MEQADELSEIPVELQIARGLDQIQAHTSKIADMQRNISSALHTSSATGTTTWDENLALVWERFEDPIQVHMSPEERVDVNDLIRTDNDLLNRVMVVFAYLCDEVQYLEQTAEETFYGPLLVFGEAAHDDESELKMGEEEEQIGRMLHFFQDLSNFVDRINSVVLSIVQQMTSLYQARQRMYISTFKFVHMKPVFSALGDCIRVLMTLDMLVTENDCIVSAWLAYKKMMQVVRADPKRFDWDENKVKTYEKLLVSLDQTVMAGAMFQSCVEADFESPQEDDGDDGGRRIDIMDNRVFLKEFFTLLSEDLEENVAAIGHPAETNHRVRLMGTLGVYVLYRRLVPQNLRPNEVFYKKLWEVQLTTPSISICGKLSFFPADFLRQHVPPPMNLKKLKPSDPSKHRREYLAVIQSKFASKVSSLHKGLCQWCVRVHGTCRPVSQLRGAPLPNVLAEQSAIVVSGILLAYRVKNTLEEFMSLHLALDASIDRTAIANIGRCVEVLKGLQLTFHSHEVVFAQGVAHMVNQLKMATMRLLLPLKQRLSASKKMDDTKIDVLAAVTLIEDIFGGCQSMSFTRLCITELALRVILMEGIIKQNISTELIRTIEQMKILSEWQTHIRKACDLSGTLYWSRGMLVPLLKALYTNGGEEANRIPYIIQSFSDPLPLLHSMLHENDQSADAILKSYKKFVNDSFTKTIITPLCRDIEKNLRLQIHAVHLHHMNSPNPKTEKIRSLARFLKLNQLRMFDVSLDVKKLVSEYLEKEFYDLTVLALHDYKTYAEMRHLARETFGLHIGDSHLPLGSLNQGLDVLQIVRNIHVFVTRYNYNMNAQIFVERKPSRGAKHLNTINTQSIANSIRTHGLGMLNTTINFTYQFLTKKFEIFTQFLFDEYIKGYLAKERRWYKKNKNDLDFKYPFDRAYAFTKDIRKLGVTKSKKKDGDGGGLTYLDQFRLLITHVGNALGYVRMVRSAGMHFCSDAVKFVPDLENIIEFAKYAGEGQEASSKKEAEAENEDDDEGEEKEEIIGAKLSEER